MGAKIDVLFSISQNNILLFVKSFQQSMLIVFPDR